ncbi:erythromycin esterase family protein [Tenuibacillus multivorans]|uniref:erythromycin esterase family protein n=1 Tax=Tenuibacillus multivorans TaxID=237069 RepID=UPI0021C1E2A3|nr:erythromycin esterase family protein [Tenuibacillus multivorans]
MRYLHQHHGFNVVVLESGLLEATLCKEYLNDYPPEIQIPNSLLDIYHNEEMKPLFSEKWAQSIRISGMDPQPTYPLVSEHMIKWLKNHTDHELYEKMKIVEELYFELQDEMLVKITKPLKKKMKFAIEEYESLIRLIDIKYEIFTNHEVQRMLQLIQKGMQDRMNWLQINLKGYLSSGVQRGFNMFQNLEWLMKHFYKNEKIIVWAHNFHIRKRQSLYAKLLGIKSVGYWLQKKYPDDFYAIGLYAGSGNFATQIRVELEIFFMKENHLEELLLDSSAYDLFLPLDSESQTTDKKVWYKRKWWLLESNFSGLGRMLCYPKDHYDAIIFHNKVRPPRYFKKSENRGLSCFGSIIIIKGSFRKLCCYLV